MNILVINPGSTSTKVGVCMGNDIIKETFSHDRETINGFQTIFHQKEFRYQCIMTFLKTNGWDRLNFDAVVGRGGLIKPVEGGVYEVNEPMLKDLEAGVNGEHASNLGGVLAKMLGEGFSAPAYIVDPVVVDELEEPARFTGLAGTERKSLFHALNQKASARNVADKMGKPYENVNLIVVHMGGGISIGAHKKGRVVDVNNALSGDGPFAPERAGGIPVDGIVKLIKEDGYTADDLIRAVSREGGVYSYLGTVDIKELGDRYQAGDKTAGPVFEAMIYQIVKEIGGLAAILGGEVDGIVLTGGIAFSGLVTGLIQDKVRFIADVYIEPGEYEIEALANGAIRVLQGEETAKDYK